MIDPFYTPDSVAHELAAAGLASQPTATAPLVVDVAAGHGSLLAAVASIRPKAEIFGGDLDPSAVRELRRRGPDWRVGRVDALNPRSVAQSVVSAAWGTYDLAVANPPFSCRGQRTIEVTTMGSTVRCSPGVAFMLVSLSAVRTGGAVAAVLPADAAQLVRDQDAWSLIHRHALVSVGPTWARGTFAGAVPATQLVLLQRRGNGAGRVEVTDPPATKPGVEGWSLTRGWLHMHMVEADQGGVPLIHTTDLTTEIGLDRLRRVRSGRSVTGPAVLLPRVGKPDPGKVSVLRGGPVALSDCVFAVHMPTTGSAQKLASELVDRWKAVEGAYLGPCAPHMTLARLRTVLMTEFGDSAAWTDLP